VAFLDWAEETARMHLEDALPRRWTHVQEVANRAGRLAARLDVDGELLHAAAWVHDVGYAPDLAATKFHPLDGARYLRGVGAPERVVGLVAFHSSAETEAEFLGLGGAMREFADERTLVRDLLWYTDMTIGPSGEHMTFERRMAEVRERYPDDHYVVQALDAGMDERRQAVARAERWIEQVGLTGQV
jgi:putative nucleotidyltransferase with HDIG domain